MKSLKSNVATFESTQEKKICLSKFPGYIKQAIKNFIKINKKVDDETCRYYSTKHDEIYILKIFYI